MKILDDRAYYMLKLLKLEESNPLKTTFKSIDSSSIVSFSSDVSEYLPLQIISKPSESQSKLMR